jgi:hypothetical protein
VFLDPFQEHQIEIDGGITRSVSPVRISAWNQEGPCQYNNLPAAANSSVVELVPCVVQLHPHLPLGVKNMKHGEAAPVKKTEVVTKLGNFQIKTII